MIAWKRIGRKSKHWVKLKKWYKKFTHRRNRRINKQNPLSQDKRLDPWEID